MHHKELKTVAAHNKYKRQIQQLQTFEPSFLLRNSMIYRTILTRERTNIDSIY